MDTYARFLYQLQMKKIRLPTSAEDTVLCELKCGMDISSNTLCAIKGKKKLAPTPHTQSSKFLWQRAKGWVSIYSQGRVFDLGSCHEPGPIIRREARVMLGRQWSRFMPQTGTDTPK
jgi:hypothetical protein